LRVTTSRSASSSSSWPFRTTTIRHGTSKSFVSKNKKKVFLLCVVTCSVHPDLEQNILQPQPKKMSGRKGMSEWLMDGRCETMSIWRRVSWIHSCKYMFACHLERVT
jgi:hypothetical protein